MWASLGSTFCLVVVLTLIAASSSCQYSQEETVSKTEARAAFNQVLSGMEVLARRQESLTQEIEELKKKGRKK